MYFCPDCANMLMYELPHMGRPARLYCRTCAYIYPIEGNVKLKRKVRLVKKRIDPIFSDEDLVHLNKTQGVTCPDCGHGEAAFAQVQTRSADEPMTIFYNCTSCKRTWAEN